MGSADIWFLSELTTYFSFSDSKVKILLAKLQNGIFYDCQDSTNRRCLRVSEQMSRNVLSERLLYLTKYQSKLKPIVFSLFLLFTQCYMKTPKMTPGIVQKLKAQNSVECELKGINNKWFEGPLISRAAKQANFHQFSKFTNAWRSHSKQPAYWIKLSFGENRQIIFFSFLASHK